MSTSLNAFVSYAAEDETLCEILKRQLAVLIRHGFIGWHDQNISPGREWAHEIDIRIRTADIILLLISADFVASDFCYSIVMKQAMERHEAGEARVIPIILRPVDWKDTPFSKLQVLPLNGIPVTSAQWGSLDEAFYAVAQGLRQMIEENLPGFSKDLTPDSVLVQSKQHKAKTFPQVWKVPYLPNPFFSGREDVLTSLHEALLLNKQGGLIQPQVLSGLGGIGKTQTAVEYVYRYYSDYEFVLWVKADTREALTSDFVSIADMLHLSSKSDQDQSHAVNAVKYWLSSNTAWLLILDNVEDLVLAMDFIPMAGKGHTLLTTRSQPVGGIARRVEVEKMKPEEGALLLLRRIKIIPPEAPLEQASEFDRTIAEKISEMMDGLPLAIDQAGAYIEETASNLSDYLDLYQTQRTELLKLRGELISHHPESVVTTWSLSFERISRTNPSAVELLRLCAFLQPDRIPEEIIIEGASELGPVLQSTASNLLKLNAAIRELLRYSFIRRYPDTRTLAIHRLLQDVLQDEMSEEMQRQWAERTVRAVNRAFPNVEFDAWQRCQRILPHAQVSAELIERCGMKFGEATRLLNLASIYLCDRGHYAQALPLCNQALAIREQTLGKEHLDVAQSLVTLTAIYRGLGQYNHAESCCKQALSIRERLLGPEHLDVAQSLNDLAWLYIDLDKAAMAESFCQRALAIREQLLGPEHLDVAESLNCLAWLYDDRCMFHLVESNYQRALAIRERILGPNHPKVGETLNNLGWYYRVRRQYDRAEPLFDRALAVRQQTLGPTHPDVASTLNNMARLYMEQGKDAEAEPLLQQALDIQKKTLGLEHRKTTQTFSSLARLYLNQRNFIQAEILFLQTLKLREQMFGPNHPKVATSLNELAELYLAQDKTAQAEALLERALAIAQKSLETDHLVTAAILENYAMTLRLLNKENEAVNLERYGRRDP